MPMMSKPGIPLPLRRTSPAAPPASPDPSSLLRRENAQLRIRVRNLEEKLEARERPEKVSDSVVAAAVRKERERVLAIQGIRVYGQEALRRELLEDPSVSVEQAAYRLFQAQAESGRKAGESFLAQVAQDEAALPTITPAVESNTSEQDQAVAAILTAGKRAGHSPA